MVGADGQTADLIDHLERHLDDTMDFALIRERRRTPQAQAWPDLPASGQSRRTVASAVRVVTSTRGEARIYRLETQGTGAAALTRYRYEVLGDHDPLDLVGSVREFLIPNGGPSVDEACAALGRAITSSDGLDGRAWQELLSYTLRPDVIYQLSHLCDSERAGTVNVFPAAAVGMNSGVPGRHAGEAFGEKNGTQLYRGAGLRRASIQTARNGSLPVTILHWLADDLAFDGAGAESDGGVSPFAYPSLLGEPAFAVIRR